MAKTAAEKQKDYRDRQRNAQEPETVTRVTNGRDGNAPDYGGSQCGCTHCQQNRTNGTKHTLNHGPYKPAHELGTNELNRVALPGDQDYEEHSHEFHQAGASAEVETPQRAGADE